MFRGLIQLVAYGAQDEYLTSTPKTTFFVTAYNRLVINKTPQYYQNQIDTMYRMRDGGVAEWANMPVEMIEEIGAKLAEPIELKFDRTRYGTDSISEVIKQEIEPEYVKSVETYLGDKLVETLTSEQLFPTEDEEN